MNIFPQSLMLATLGLATPRAVLAQRPETPRCPVAQIAPSEYPRLVDSLQVHRGDSLERDGYPQLEADRAAVLVGKKCVTVVTLNWDGELNGGLVFLDSKGDVIAAESYHGARAPKAAGTGRLLFVYTATKGSGMYESRYAVLCSLDPATWIECFDTPARKLDIVSGTESEAGMMLEQRATAVVQGDTLILHRSVAIQHPGDVRPRVKDLGSSRVRLP
jgi:hypothetical protein